MIHSVDISDQTFNCVKCGNCCYNVLREHNTGEYGYNFRGELVQNPKTSLTILYNEKYELKQNLINYDLQARFYPEMVFFMENYPYGFIYSYQLGVKKKKYCMFYDLSKRECKIYPVRPIICKTYPLGCNAFEGSNLLPEAMCTGVIEMVHQVDPSIGEGELVYYPSSQDQMTSAFRIEFFLGANIIGFSRWELKTILDNLGSMFLDDKKATPSRVSDYTLLNFREFLSWAKVKITEKHQKLKIQRFSQNLEFGKQHFAQQLTNKTMNPQETEHSEGTFLLPVCFNKEILQKFYQKPEIYTVSEGSSINGPIYNLPYNNTPENSIMVYLGDLKGLPLEELLYFRGYNIPCPRKFITDDRYRRDFLVEFTEPTELEHHLKTNIVDLNKAFQKQFQFPLFKLDRAEVKENLKQIRIPLTREMKEYNDIVLAMNKVFVESISSKELKQVIKDIDKVKGFKSLKILEEFLTQEFPNLTIHIKFLFHLNDLRSTDAAHLSGKNYQDFLIEHNFKENETVEIVEWLLKGILTFLKDFNSLLDQRNNPA